MSDILLYAHSVKGIEYILTDALFVDDRWFKRVIAGSKCQRPLTQVTTSVQL